MRLTKTCWQKSVRSTPTLCPKRMAKCPLFFTLLPFGQTTFAIASSKKVQIKSIFAVRLALPFLTSSARSIATVVVKFLRKCPLRVSTRRFPFVYNLLFTTARGKAKLLFGARHNSQTADLRTKNCQTISKNYQNQ